MTAKRFRSARISRWNYLGQRENACSQTNCTHFDLLVSRLQTELVTGTDKVEGLKDELLSRLQELPVSLNQVKARAETINQVRSAAFWDSVTPASLEEVRHKLRGTMQYRVRQTRAEIGRAH